MSSIIKWHNYGENMFSFIMIVCHGLIMSFSNLDIMLFLSFLSFKLDEKFHLWKMYVFLFYYDESVHGVWFGAYVSRTLAN